jgi:X-Pro dipeptidyl-peptidase
MRALGRARPAAALAVLAAALAVPATAVADPPEIVVSDGVTQPVFSYANAIRERVWIPVPGVDQNSDGVPDRVAVDIIRPLETSSGLKVPAIIDTSPYYTSLGRGNESEFLHSTAAGYADKFPLFYDNYFVPRGYAFIAAQAVGTAWSTGCPLHGGPGDVAGFKAVIDWLRGRVPAYDSRTTSDTEVVADWNNGKNAMFGKSYDGTFANGVAATGVEGLTTIIPISGISAWYDYSRSNGIRQNTGTHYPASLSNTITQNTNLSNLGVAPPSNNAACAASRTAMSAVDGDADGNYNAFWNDRDYNKDVANVQASVFVSHGINDNNVKPDHFSKWWAGLAANDVPRKLWLTQTGHVDPFDYRRAEWVSTIHKWFDYWLQGVPNGIMDEPRAMIETAPDVFEDHADWPLPGTADVSVFLRGGATTSVAGDLGLSSGGPLATRLLTDSPNQSENTMINNPTGSQTNRLVFLSPPLSQPLRVSGTPTIDTFASFNKTSANVGALIVDYNTTSFPKITRSNEGITTTTTETCWGETFGIDDPCYREVSKPTTNVTSWRVTKGILDAVNRDSYFTDSPLTAGTQYELTYPTLPTDYTFEAGHQIGVILVSNYSGYSAITNTTAPTAQVTVDTLASKVLLPVVGGYSAAVASGGFSDTVAPTLGLPGDITQEATAPATPVAFTVTVSDDADPNPTLTCSHASGFGFPVGQTTVNCTATDGAGNAASGSFKVTITDTTAPVLTLPGNITRDATGATTPVTWSASAADVADPTPAFACLPASGFAFPTGTTTVICSATDASGNAASGSFTVTIEDATNPVSNAVLSGTLNLGWWRNPTVTITAVDQAPGLSGIQTIEYRLDGGPWTTYAGPFQVTGDGARLLEYHATDNAGNAEAVRSLGFNVDGTAPSTSASLAPPAQGGYYRTPLVTLASSDGAGSGAAGIQYTVDGSGTRSYNGPFLVAGDGSHTITFRAVDLTGLVETTKTLTFGSDATAPATKATFSPGPVNGYYGGPTAVTLTGGDFGGSGISSIEYLLDGGGWTAYSGPVAVSGDGHHSIQFHATDNAGNVESVKTKSFTIDAAGPVIALTRPAEGEQIALYSAVTPLYTCADAVSGVSSCSGPAALQTGPVGPHSYTVTAVDNAGNMTSVTHSYNVYWPGFGWVSPPSTASAGSKVSIRFQLGGVSYGLGILAAGSPSSYQVSCTTGAAMGAASPTASSGSLSYSSGRYTYPWKSQSGWRNTCRRFVLDLADSTQQTLTIRFT